VKNSLQSEIYKTAFDIDEAGRFDIEIDPEVSKGIEALPKARELVEKAKKTIVQRMTPEARAALR
jgi:hypothetical protein